MPKWMIWAARVSLVGVMVLAVLGAFDANDRIAAVRIPPDKVNHGALSYALTFLLLASFRRARPIAIGALMMTVGTSLEALQWIGLFAGDAQVGDLIADAGGITLAVAPVWVGRVQGRRTATEG